MADSLAFRTLLGNAQLAATTLNERTHGGSAPYIKVVGGVASLLLKNFQLFKKVCRADGLG